MDHRRVAAVSVGLILAVTLVSGPLVGAVDLTPASRQEFAPGTGSADVTVRSVPDAARLERGEYGSGSYYLRVPDATLRIEDVRRQPILVYKIRIPALGYVRGTTTFLSPGDEGTLELELAPDALPPDEVDRERYRAELVIVLRGADGERVLHEADVTVEVTG